MASTGTLKKINGEHRDDPPATHLPHEPELLSGLPDKFDAEEDMSRSRPHDEELLRVLFNLSTGQEKVNATQDKICDTLDVIAGKINNGNVTKTPNWVIPIIATILFALIALTFKSVTDSVARMEMKQEKLETYNQRTREEFALHGWHIDPDTGKMTKIQPQKEAP